MTDEKAKQIKAQCLGDIRGYMRAYEGGNPLLEVDPRVRKYILDCVREDVDRANLYELLGIRKGLRMGYTYGFNTEKARKVLQCYEGIWDGDKRREYSGGLQFAGLRGRTYYKLTPLQVWELVNPFGIMRRGETRRRITECVYFIPRKSSKTTLAAFFQLWFFMFEDNNSEGYCLSNSQTQSQILFKLVYDLVHQLDPKERYIRFTATQLNWKPGQRREAKVMAMTASSKAKDGAVAQLCVFDEAAAAGYIKGRCDAMNTFQVMEGSMGTRLEPMSVYTTTASRVNRGPFEIKLEGIKEALLKEMEAPLDGQPLEREVDHNFSVICCPDQWEEDEQSLQRPEVAYKVNRHIGITVQPDYYVEEWKRMKLDPEKKKEQITKLYNVFQSSRVKPWVKAADIARLQGERKSVDTLKTADGWMCFAGMDFSRGDDLCAIAYLCYNSRTKQFFGDCDAWITRRSLDENPNTRLYHQWQEQGWLRVCEGDVVTEPEVIDRLMEVAASLRLMRIGYDPYDSMVFVNYLGGYLRARRVDPKNLVKPVRQTNGAFNASVQTLERLIALKAIEFSRSPLLPWCFGNCLLDVDRMDNAKPVKASPNAKIDPVICLLEGLILMQDMMK
ncbi:MAG: terminase large subunit [Prevotellaceae bacterium]|nr:terminase large subunit [Prevotellaceae bacterium]